MSAAIPSQVGFPLAISLAFGRLREPAAWFVPGLDAEQWIREMTQWGISLVGVRLFLVPSGIGNLHPCGVLVVTDDAPVVKLALPYAKLGDRLFFPADARLDPEISSQEASVVFTWDIQVLHPTAGLVGFRQSDALSVAALLCPPVRRQADWNCAEAGVPRRPPLSSVLPEAMPSMEDILEFGQDDIGSQIDEYLPQSPDEWPLLDAAKQALRAGLRPLAHLVVRLLSADLSRAARPAGQGQKLGKTFKVPRNPGPLRKWATAKFRAINEAIIRHRNRELIRLLNLLQSDPDAGLQYALPLRDMATRGIAPPNASLGQQRVEFNLGQLLGGHLRSDRWSVPLDLQQQLRHRYREAANRELNLGRFSRAAYIFAHLLGDFSAAADSLKRGRNYREAAVIYKEKLKNPRAAADCLVAGGLLLEAIPVYISLRLFEVAAGLYERLGQIEQADDCYRQRVAELVGRKDFVGAARLLETKLRRPDEALEMLADGWPETDGAGVCLREWFKLCGKLGRHEQAAARIPLLHQGTLRFSQSLTLIQALSSVAVSYANPEVRFRAADTSRVLAGNLLPGADSNGQRALVQSVVSLVSADKLLARDGNRFLSRKVSKPAFFSVKGTPTLVRSFRLPSHHEWCAVVPTPLGFLAVGSRGRGFPATLVRGNWDGKLQFISISLDMDRKCVLLPPGPGAAALLAQLGPPPPGTAIVRTPGDQARLTKLRLPAIDDFPEELNIDSPPYDDEQCLGICRDENGATWLAAGTVAGAIHLAAYTPDGALLSSHSLKLPLDVGRIVAAPLPMAVRHRSVYIAYGNRIIRFSAANAQPSSLELPFDIRTLTPNPTFTVTRLIACFSGGCALVQDFRKYRLLAQDLMDPAAAFMQDGSIVVAGVRGGQLYQRNGAEIEFRSAFKTECAPLVLLPATIGEFAIFDSVGNVNLYRFDAT